MDKKQLNYIFNLKGRGKKKDVINTVKWEQDCKKISDELPLPDILPATRRIIAIGDLHGDWNQTINSLKTAGVIDNDHKWTGGDTVVVQIGDQVDRCRGHHYKCDDKRATMNDEASDIKILKFFTKLHAEAQKEGGAVYSLLGNHELMNVLGDVRYVSYEGLKQFENSEFNGKIIKDGKKARIKAFERGGELSNFLGCTRQAAIIIGSNLFVHAGIVPELAKKYKVDDINSIIRKWLLKKNKTVEETDSIVKSSDYSPFWIRYLGQIPPQDDENEYCSKYVDPVLELYDVKNIIVGHTPQSFITDEGINSTCNNKVWRVDVGVSDAFSIYEDDFKKKGKTLDRSVQVLEILNDREFKVLK
jgi:hypothetical protein